MSFLTTILVAFAIGFTGSATAAPEQPVTAQQQVQQGVQHDPILAMDAKATLEESEVTKAFTDEERQRYYMADYVGSDVSSDSMYGEFTLESIDFPGTFHHYHYTELRGA